MHMCSGKHICFSATVRYDELKRQPVQNQPPPCVCPCSCLVFMPNQLIVITISSSVYVSSFEVGADMDRPVCVFVFSHLYIILSLSAGRLPCHSSSSLPLVISTAAVFHRLRYCCRRCCLSLFTVHVCVMSLS